MKKTNKIHILLYIISALFVFAGVLVYVVADWIGQNFSTGIQEILFTINNPMVGANTDIVDTGVKDCLPIILFLWLVVLVFWIADYKNRVQIFIKGKLFGVKSKICLSKWLRIFALFLSVAFFALSLFKMDSVLGISEYLELKSQSTQIYEEHYVFPNTVEITATESKNLIYIYLESMENSYQSEQEGGLQQTNLMPHLTALAKENISFSDDENIGGFRSVTGTEWTAGALLASSSGVPFAFSVGKNSMDACEQYAPGLTMLGDVLQDKGYTQMFLCGSDASFGGRRKMYTQHGNYHIYDLYTARENGDLPTSDYDDEFWGFEDMYLYEIAKKQITKLYEAGKPFNVTMLTVDTHFPEGHLCSKCGNKYDSVAANVVECADRQVADFVAWCKTQPFYKDTVIVISGDHIRMDKALVESEPIRLNRTNYNCFINASVTGDVNMKNRDFTAMDMFPTVLSAMGFEISGNRLGLGTNLFSNVPTLAEEMGLEAFEREISKHSLFYENAFGE